MTTATKTRPTADEINEYLKSGGVVQLTTYTKSTLYEKKNAGMFFESNGNLMVKRGKRSDQISFGDQMGCAIRFGRYV